ncbi:MAG: DUF4166 domain-containing protein [Alphaproteobacteria bacterium]|nr:DUF4166 domain-containing protein [Alphaproteobacteria bacterium]
MLRLVSDRSVEKPVAARSWTHSADLDDLRFRALVGAEAWSRLPKAVQTRFAKRLTDQRAAMYAGEIIETRMNPLGWLLAQATRLIGAPLPLTRDADVPATVTITEDGPSKGQYWTRVYGRHHGFPQVIHSSKRFRGPTGLEEYIGRGVGMALTVHADDYAIRFRSDHYFMQLLGLRLRLPKWLSPGTVTVSHIDFGPDQFAFVLDLHHPLFGELVHQRGIFRDTVFEE